MKMTNPIESSGYFYIPEMATEKLPGTLRISTHGEVTLDITYLSPKVDPRKIIFGVNPKEGEYVESIIGDIERGRKYDVVSMRRCRCIKWHSSFDLSGGGMSISLTFLAQICFIGAKYYTDTEVSFSEIAFSVKGINEWIGSRVAVMPISKGNNPMSGISVTCTPPDPIKIHLYNDMQLEFHARWSGPLSSFVHKAEISQYWFARLICNKTRPVEELLDIVSRIRNFLYFAIDEITYLEFIHGYSSAHKIIYGTDRKTEMKTIKIYYKSSPVAPTEAKSPWYHMTFSYGLIECSMERLINNWLIENERHHSSFNLYFDVRSGVYLHLETRFLSLVQGIEALHRKMRKGTVKSKNEIPLRYRLNSMLKEFSRFYGEKEEREEIAQSIVATRNYLTHYDDDLEEKSAKGQDLLSLHEKLEALFQLQILRLIGMDSNTISEIVENNRNILGKLGRNP